MLREIISITGKPGLFKIITSGNGRLIVEDINDKHRFAAGQRDRVVSLGDIAMYTESGDTPLGDILDKLYAVEGGKEIDIKGIADSKALRARFEAAVEDFDRDRVHDSDIKKLFTWYNLLVRSGMKEFAEKKDAEEADNAAEDKK